MKINGNMRSTGQSRRINIGFQIKYTIKEFLRLCRYGMVQNRIFVVLRDKKLIYLSNPKVGCSSIKQTLTQDIQGDGSSIHKYSFDEVHKVPENIKDFHSFTFVRNPFKRLVSCYIDKYQGDLDKDWEQLTFDYYLLGVMRKDKGFEQFVKNVARIPDCLSNKHFRSQYRLTHDFRNRKLVKEIGHLENIGEEFSALQVCYNLGNLPHYNKSKDYSWMDYYTHETAHLVYKRFRKDIELFGYQEDYQQLMQHLNEAR